MPKKVSDADRKRIAELEKAEAVLKDEVSKLKVWNDFFSNKLFHSLHIKLIVNCAVVVFEISSCCCVKCRSARRKLYGQRIFNQN